MQKRRIHISLIFAIVLSTLAAVLWIQRQQREYMLNRHLIASLVKYDGEGALRLTNLGADLNTRFDPPPKPSLKYFWDKLCHRSPPPDDSPTAFLIACGSGWPTAEEQDSSSPFPNMDDAALIRAMVAHGAKPNARDEDAESALCLAIGDHRFHTACARIESGANVREQMEDGDTLLHRAAESGDLPTVDEMLKHGAAVNAQTDYGTTPLDNAIEHNSNTTVIRELLAHGANPNLATKDGDTPMSIARYDNQIEVIKLLKQYGAKENNRPIRADIPAIAQVLGVRMGYNGQDGLERRLGEPFATTGGHSHGRKLWSTATPPGQIDTDGFPYNEDGLVLEELTWQTGSKWSSRVPVIRHLPPRSGWLGVIYPGMSVAHVTNLIAGRVPPPQKQGNTWRWIAIGYIKANRGNNESYTRWTAELTFRYGVLVLIDLQCG